MKLSWKPAPPPMIAVEDDAITTPVYVPRGTIDTVSDDAGGPRHHRVTHARDTIHVHPASAGISIALDDGSGEGYNFPMPCDNVAVHLRRKGERRYVLVLNTVSAQYGSTLEIRFPHEWYRLPPGYYEGRIRFSSGDRHNEGGWILLHKDSQPSARTVGAEQVRFRPDTGPHRRHGPGHTIEQQPAVPDLDCGDCDAD